jgi:hypothetical protein
MCLDVVVGICIGIPLIVAYKVVRAPYKAGRYLWRQHKDAVAKRAMTSSDNPVQDFKLIRDQLENNSICGPMLTDVEPDSLTEDGGH